ncbi:hypothetical protein [Promicromonospora sp. MEB111]|uniref:hypothetical protein n=1 Tax=Promicromonospora sp. MEB111 TaxID=3040301 RepID=UPI00254AF720|nr:hypothetical protein [Promicromonospora sp. MEB111]
MIRIVRSLAVGFALACILLIGLRLDHGAPAWWLPVALVVSILAVALTAVVTTLVGIGGTSALRTTPSVDVVVTAEREGRLHLAKVLDISSTGTEINDDPVAELRLAVAARTRAAYTTTTRALIDRTRLPQFQPGAVVVVLQEKADAPGVTLLQSPPQSWREKAAQADTVARMDEPDEWAAVPVSAGRDARGLVKIPAVLLALLVLVGFAARLYPVREDVAAVLSGTPLLEVSAAQERRVDREASTLDPVRAQEVVDAFVAEAGDSSFTDVGLGSTTATATVPATPGSDNTDDLVWARGDVVRHEPSPIQPSDDELPLLTFDAADVDWGSLQELADRLPRQAGFEPEDLVTVRVHVPNPAFGDTGRAYEIVVWGSGPYDDASVTYGPDGEVVDMYGGAKGSEVARWDADH